MHGITPLLLLFGNEHTWACLDCGLPIYTTVTQSGYRWRHYEGDLGRPAEAPERQGSR